MCPLCIAGVAQIAAGATSAGALATFVVKKLRIKIGVNNASPTIKHTEDDYEREPNTTVERRLTS